MPNQHNNQKILNQQKYIGYVFKNRYKIKLKLKSGGYGSVYIANVLKQEQKKKYVAIKIMDISDKKYAQNQYEIYKKIQQNSFPYGFVQHYDWGLDKDKYFLVMELLDKDLQELMLKTKSKRFSLKTVLMIGLQILDRLQAYHKIGYIHRDVKPDNIVIGFGQKQKTIHLIDFGISKPSAEIRPEEKNKLIGSFGYMSCRMHQAKHTGIVDDIQSMIYTLMFLLNGTLPWMRVRVDKIQDAKKVLILKKQISPKDFKSFEPPQLFFDILNQVKKKNYDQKIDYLKLKYKFLQLLKNQNEQNDLNFDWCLNKNQHYQKNPKLAKLNANQKIVQNEIFEVYKFLKDSAQKSKQSPLKKKLSPQKNKQKQKNAIVQKRPSTAKIDQINNQKRLQSARKMGNYQNQKQKIIMSKLGLTGEMNYNGPRIVINKTAKHKI